MQAAWNHCRQQSQIVGFLTQRLKLFKSGNTKNSRATSCIVVIMIEVVYLDKILNIKPLEI